MSVLGGSVVPFGVFAIAPKVQILGGRRVQAAIGAVQLFDSSETGGVGYGVVVCFGAEKAIGRTLRFIVEGLIGGAAMAMPEQTFLGGFRVCRGPWGVDLGVVVPVYETGAGTPVPLVTITWAF